MVGSLCRRARTGALPGTAAIEGRKPPLWSLHSCRRALEILTLKRIPELFTGKARPRVQFPRHRHTLPTCFCRWKPSYAFEGN